MCVSIDHPTTRPPREAEKPEADLVYKGPASASLSEGDRAPGACAMVLHGQ